MKKVFCSEISTTFVTNMKDVFCSFFSNIMLVIDFCSTTSCSRTVEDELPHSEVSDGTPAK